MKVLRLVDTNVIELQEVEKPQAPAGQVLIEVLAAGLCHTDVFLRRMAGPGAPWGTVLGHETAGRIVEVGEGVARERIGEAVVVYPVWGCGYCRSCVQGRMNACLNTRNRFTPPPTPGSTRGVDGGMADFMLVPSPYALPIGALDPAVAAILADAALTSYHSIRAVRDLLAPGSTAVVIGVGGVGHVAVQILKAVTAATVIALDLSDEALDLVRDCADFAWRSDDTTVARVLEQTRTRGADVVLDVVGTDATLAQAAQIVAAYGAIRAIGLGGGQLPFESRWGKTVVPWGVSFTRPYSGTLQDMAEAVALAQAGAISPVVQRYPLSQWSEVFDRLEAGRVRGRAVLVPGLNAGDLPAQSLNQRPIGDL